jgi:hypothetical protein
VVLVHITIAPYVSHGIFYYVLYIVVAPAGVKNGQMTRVLILG